MERFCTITPTRGDRPELLAFCKKQLSRLTVKPDKSYFIDYPPDGQRKDLIKRVYEGCMQAKRDDFDFVYIIEDDDYIAPWYFEYMIPRNGAQFIGLFETIYYNIKTLRYQRYTHPKRSSLFCTGFRISALDKFIWPRDAAYCFLDIDLWQYAIRSRKPHELKQLYRGTMPAAIGIKHGIGLTGGKGHVVNLSTPDEKMHWLLCHVGEEEFEFYKQMNNQLCG